MLPLYVLVAVDLRAGQVQSLGTTTPVMILLIPLFRHSAYLLISLCHRSTLLVIFRLAQGNPLVIVFLRIHLVGITSCRERNAPNLLYPGK